MISISIQRSFVGPIINGTECVKVLKSYVADKAEEPHLEERGRKCHWRSRHFRRIEH